jgi:hypothetical protein
VEFNGKNTPLHWNFKTHSSPKAKAAQPAQEIFVFENENPALELKSIWTAHSGPGPIEHQIIIRNKGAAAVILPLQHSIVFDTRGPTGTPLENIWVEKGAGRPGPIGTHRTKVQKDFSATLISTPYRDEPRDAIPWTAIQDVAGQQGWYAGIEFSGRVQISLRAITDVGADRPLPNGEGQGEGEGTCLQSALELKSSAEAPGMNRNQTAVQRIATSKACTLSSPTSSSVFASCWRLLRDGMWQGCVPPRPKHRAENGDAVAPPSHLPKAKAPRLERRGALQNQSLSL